MPKGRGMDYAVQGIFGTSDIDPEQRKYNKGKEKKKGKKKKGYKHTGKHKGMSHEFGEKGY